MPPQRGSRRKTWSDNDKGRAYFALQANDWNVDRSSKETKIPISTVRLWAQDWKVNGCPSNIESLAIGVARTWIHEALELQDAVLERMKMVIPNSSDLRALVTAFSTLNDKTTRAQGFATERVEHKHTLPSPEEQEALMDNLIKSLHRSPDITIDAEEVEQAGIPASTGR